MSKRMCLIVSVGISLFVVSFGCSASVAPESTKSENSPFVRMLEKQYETHLNAERNGDVAIVRQIRTADMVQLMESHLKNPNDSEEFSSRLKEMAPYQHRYQEFKFLGCEQSMDSARLRYMKESTVTDASHQAFVEFLVVMFRQEQNVWKVGRIGHVSMPRFRKDGTPADSMDQFKDQQQFQIASQ